MSFGNMGGFFMDLRNGTITVSEVLRQPGARQILQRYFPKVAGNPLMLNLASSWSLNQVIAKVGGRVDGALLQQMQGELERL
jgi:hypothetical protein